ncbi:MobA protein, partial [Muribaculaceae bacterium Isolate-080 (Janvier)]
RMDEDENRQFKLMFQKSEAVHHSKFIKSVLLNRTIKIIKIDPATTDFYIRLTNFYHQFQAIGNNYNQVVKAVKTNFGDKRAFVLLRKLEKETVELVIVSRQIVALINEYKEKYLDTHLPD